MTLINQAVCISEWRIKVYIKKFCLVVTPAPDVLKTTIFAARWRLTLTGLAGSQRIMPLVTVWSAPEREMETWSPAKALPPREEVVSRVTDLTVAVSLRGAMRTVSFFWM